MSAGVGIVVVAVGRKLPTEIGDITAVRCIGGKLSTRVGVVIVVGG